MTDLSDGLTITIQPLNSVMDMLHVIIASLSFISIVLIVGVSDDKDGGFAFMNTSTASEIYYNDMLRSRVSVYFVTELS